MVKLTNQALTKICLIGFLFIFCIVYYIENHYELELIEIENISNKNLNHHIKIYGEVISQRQSKNTLFITIKDRSNIISAILFNHNTSLEKNQKYYFEGKVDYYKDKYQLIIKNIYI